MINLILGLLSNYKYWVIGVLIAITISFTYYKGHSNGFDSGKLEGHKIGLKDGIKQERDRLDIEYNDILAKRLKQNSENLKKQFDLELEAEKASKKTDIIYKDRVETITKIVRENPKFDIKECKDKLKLTSDEMKVLNRKENE